MFDELRVGGLTPLTTIDYPEHLSCVIYCQGCAWRCLYCHNPELIPVKAEQGFDNKELEFFLKRRKGLLDAVVFSGGEPLLQKGLLPAMQTVKSMGFKVGLHTGGSSISRFKQVLEIVDWVGFDVKDLPEHADRIIQVNNAGNTNWQSLRLLLASGVDYQCRTTVHWDLISPERVLVLAKQLVSEGVNNYNLQIARTRNTLDKSLIDDSCSYSMISKDIRLALSAELEQMFDQFEWVE
ncbi:anaerobic ribonucleoside-triphosphate reductase activating protein [Kangiella sediminilitoris]|uniref:Anaerobic ribonucleoside-triphosphate reductase activating protein n=1 Tax=Kangiella sediminilitoris TaxID=1144748 RepID=A0A1B3BAL9_9GAMM|nr:anaerobic ribonucleoside-triphosphate reductase activating protein [Kangiella sediminilitoris]AOE49837.1 Anaerobic ribonucleoside-triphosphate reductase activating protein [Kangiella sediminilitoris]